VLDTNELGMSRGSDKGLHCRVSMRQPNIVVAVVRALWPVFAFHYFPVMLNGLLSDTLRSNVL
jgi:hypothetical protein